MVTVLLYYSIRCACLCNISDKGTDVPIKYNRRQMFMDHKPQLYFTFINSLCVLEVGAALFDGVKH